MRRYRVPESNSFHINDNSRLHTALSGKKKIFTVLFGDANCALVKNMNHCFFGQTIPVFQLSRFLASDALFCTISHSAQFVRVLWQPLRRVNFAVPSLWIMNINWPSKYIFFRNASERNYSQLIRAWFRWNVEPFNCRSISIDFSVPGRLGV